MPTPTISARPYSPGTNYIYFATNIVEFFLLAIIDILCCILLFTYRCAYTIASCSNYGNRCSLARRTTNKIRSWRRLCNQDHCLDFDLQSNFRDEPPEPQNSAKTMPWRGTKTHQAYFYDKHLLESITDWRSTRGSKIRDA